MVSRSYEATTNGSPVFLQREWAVHQCCKSSTRNNHHHLLDLLLRHVQCVRHGPLHRPRSRHLVVTLENAARPTTPIALRRHDVVEALEVLEECGRLGQNIPRKVSISVRRTIGNIPKFATILNVQNTVLKKEQAGINRDRCRGRCLLNNARDRVFFFARGIFCCCSGTLIIYNWNSWVFMIVEAFGFGYCVAPLYYNAVIQ